MVSDSPNPENSLRKKGKTPAVKQLRRYKNQKEEWSEKATQRALTINAKDKRIVEIQKSRDLHKKKNAEINVQIKMLTSELNEVKQRYADEKMKNEQKNERGILAKAAVKKVVIELNESNIIRDELFDYQLELQGRIQKVNIEINTHKYELLNDFFINKSCISCIWALAFARG